MLYQSPRRATGGSGRDLRAGLACCRGREGGKSLKNILEAYVDIVTEAMSHNEEIVLIGFGTLIPRPQTERLARNPKTGTPVMIPARTTVKFKPGKYLLDAINKPEEKK